MITSLTLAVFTGEGLRGILMCVLILLDLSPLASCMMGLQIFEAMEINTLYIWLCCSTIPEMPENTEFYTSQLICVHLFFFCLYVIKKCINYYSCIT